MIKNARFVLAVPDLKKSAQFYRDVLGFSIREFGDPGWRLYVRDGCAIMAGECPDATPARELGDHSYFAYFEVDDIDAYYATVVAANGEILKKIVSEPWGMREFAIRTIDGHRITFGQDLDLIPAQPSAAPSAHLP
jgi:predicted enzyme related to lactoylglutathione lyase